MKVYLVRHGETDANKNDIMQGCSQNLDLNQNGIRQATKLKSKLKIISFDACFTSPLLRAWSTAIILVGDRVEIQEDQRLVERYLGTFEGKHKDLYSVEKYWDYNLNSKECEVEAIREIFKRCESFINDLQTNYPQNNTILIVAHDAIIRCLHHILLNSNRNKCLLNFKIENCFCQIYDI